MPVRVASRPSKDIVPYDFVDAIEKQKCASFAAIDELRKEAVKKGFQSRNDRSDANLLFPPTLLQNFLSNEQRRLELILGCQCAICQCFSDHGSVTVNTTLINRLRHQNEDDLRRLFAALLFMGAGFIARHLCGIHTSGLDLGPQEADIRKQFSRAREQKLWTKKGDPDADRLLAIFEEARKVFEVPRFDPGAHDTLVRYKFRGHENLPFLNEQPLGNGDRARIWSFEIHPEYRGENVPEKLVRKELQASNTGEARVFEALKLLARSKKRHFINLEFSYKYHDQENYIFKKYAGSLQDIFRGEDLSVRHPSPQNYRDSILHHWLWQGAMDIVDSLALFHSPEFFLHTDRGPITAAHFDIKPANLLVDDDGSLVLADFGDTRIAKKGERFRTSGGDYNYGPPGPRSGTDVSWSQAYDVWSMACVLTEIIEYICRRNGCQAIEEFRERRTADNNNSHEAFWMPDNGSYKLRKSVKAILREYKCAEDRYLRQVADLLEEMFAVEELKRPSMVQCSQRFATIFQNVTTDPYPQPCEGEILISDLGTRSPLRNMLTHVEGMSRITVSREKCMMFMSLNESKGKLRLVLLTVAKSPLDGKPVPTQIDSSEHYTEERLKLLSLFEGKSTTSGSKPTLQCLCEFESMHHDLRFIFDVPTEYYHFLAAVTHQERYRRHGKKDLADPTGFVHLPIKRCTFKTSGPLIASPFKNNQVQYNGGYVQLWRELSEDEYSKLFTSSRPEDRRGSTFSSKSSQHPVRAATGLSVQSASGGPTTRPQIAPSSILTPPRRIVVILPQTTTSSHRLLTINIANGISELQPGLDWKQYKSKTHVTVRKNSSRGEFLIGSFESKEGVPAIPVDPKVFQSKETLKVEWVDIEFKDETVSWEFQKLYHTCLKPESTTSL